MIRITPIALFAILALTLVTCGGAEAEPGGDLTEDDLPGMALQVTTIEIDGTVLYIDPEKSGMWSLEEVLEGTWDPEGDDAADLERFGYVAHHDQTFVRAENAPDEVFFACTGLSLYETEEGATGDMSDTITELMDSVGTVSNEGTKMVAVDRFDVATIPGAVGFILTGVWHNGTQFQTAAISFVRGPVMGIVQVASLDDRDLAPSAITMASRLEDQMAAATADR